MSRMTSHVFGLRSRWRRGRLTGCARGGRGAGACQPGPVGGGAAGRVAATCHPGPVGRAGCDPVASSCSAGAIALVKTARQPSVTFIRVIIEPSAAAVCDVVARSSVPIGPTPWRMTVAVGPFDEADDRARRAAGKPAVNDLPEAACLLRRRAQSTYRDHAPGRHVGTMSRSWCRGAGRHYPRPVPRAGSPPWSGRPGRDRKARNVTLARPMRQKWRRRGDWPQRRRCGPADR